MDRKPVLRLPEVLSIEEQGKLLSAPNKKAPTGLRNYCIMLLAANLGLRVSEIISLRLQDIDWRSGKLSISQSKFGRGRTLWIAESDLEQLGKWREARPAGAKRIFCTLAGAALSDRYIRGMVKRYARRAGIQKDVHPHTLRHTFATDLLRETKNIRLVQKALGHASLSTTMIYTHIVDDELESSLKNLRVKPGKEIRAL